LLVRREEDIPVMPPVTRDARNPLWNDPKLIESLQRLLRTRGAPASEIEDFVQEAMLQAHLAKDLPAAEPARTEYICGIARNLVNSARRRGARGPGMTPFDEDAEGRIADRTVVPADDRALAAKLVAEGAAADPKALEWLRRTKIEGESEAAVARADGVPEERVRQRISRLRKRLAGLAVGVVAGLVLLVWWMKRGHLAEVPGHIEPDIARSEKPHAPTPRDEAIALRREALHECDLGQWNECLRDLDRARDGDPGGDSSPAGRDARDRAVDALRAIERQIEEQRERRGPDHTPIDLKPPLPGAPAAPRGKSSVVR
jgi:DNA-directed RNA polymerase specialized sigma24 family protein